MEKIGILVVYLKQMKQVLIISLIILAFFMLVTKLSMGMTDADRINLVVVNKDNSHLSQELIEKLKDNPQIDLVEKKEFQVTKEVAKADGILTLNDDFESNMSSNKAVGIFRPGENGHQADYLQELILSQVLALKANQLFEENVEQAALTEEDIILPDKPLVEIKPVIAGKQVDLDKPDKLPVGILSLGLLFTFITSIPFIEKKSKRLLFYGKKAFFKQIYTLFFLLGITWLVSLTLAVLGTSLLTRESYSMSQYLTWIAFLLLIQSLFLLLRSYLSNKWLGVIFIPWLILNMTLGGGLWENPYGNHLLQSFFPVALVIEKQVLQLLVLSVLCHILYIVTSLVRIKRPKVY